MEKQKLPGASTALVLGICSIVTACCCYGLIGIILGIIGLNSAKKAKVAYEENPEQYDGMANANAGRITSIIGIVIGALYIVYLIFLIVTIGFAGIMEQNQQLMEQFQ